MERFTFFWHDNFSNWFMSEFIIKNITYNCVEQFMMAQKALVFKDTESYKLIMASKNPKEIKALGKNVKNFNTEAWGKVRKPIVKMAVKAKFKQNGIIYDKLLKTVGTTLVEASPYDGIWGIGLAAEDPRAAARETWKGLNLLGECLTEARDELIEEESKRLVAPYEVDTLIDILPLFNGRTIEQSKEHIVFELGDISREKRRLFELAVNGAWKCMEDDHFNTDGSEVFGNKFTINFKVKPSYAKQVEKSNEFKKKWGNK
jgi:ribA/ribD-fused uncharacterized protein